MRPKVPPPLPPKVSNNEVTSSHYNNNSYEGKAEAKGSGRLSLAQETLSILRQGMKCLHLKN